MFKDHFSRNTVKIEGKTLIKDDQVYFKHDNIAQSGTIKAIFQQQLEQILLVHNDNGFNGHLLDGTRYHYINSVRCQLEPIFVEETVQ